MEHIERLRNFYYSTNFQFEDDDSYFKLKSIIEDIIRYYDGIIPIAFEWFEDEDNKKKSIERGNFKKDLGLLNAGYKSTTSQKKKAFEICMHDLDLDFDSLLNKH